jgi:hypothetical protein
MRLAEYAVRIGEVRNAWRIFAVKPIGKMLFDDRSIAGSMV